MFIFLSVSSQIKTIRGAETPLYFWCTEFPLLFRTFLNIHGQHLELAVKMCKIHVLSLKTTMYVRRLKT